MSKSQTFKAKIYKIGINPYVRVPKRVSKAFNIRGNIPVMGKLNNLPIRATLVPIGGGRHRLYINGAMRKRATVDVGDTVHLQLEIDKLPRHVKAPDYFIKALKMRKSAIDAFKSMPPSHQKELLVWILDAKKPETRERRIKKGIEHILKNYNQN